MSRIEQQIVQQVLEDIDLSKFKPAIEKAVQEYFKSESFADDVAEAMADTGIGYELASAIGKKVFQEVKKGVKISLGA